MAQKVQPIGGAPLTTITVTASDDTVHVLPDSVLSRAGTGDDPSGHHDSFHVMISVETNALRFTFGVDPIPSVKGKPVNAGQDIHLTSRAQIRGFRWCNAVAGANAKIHIYPDAD